MPTVVIESHIPFVGDAFAGVADVRVLAPEDINADAVREADALIVRTRTKCNAALLEGSNVRFVATATIGTDHIDKEYCREKGIEVVSAPGCNAPAVAQYVWASIFSILDNEQCGNNLTIGIVGLGHVGSIVATWAKKMGMRVLACDPPRELIHGGWNVSAPLEAGSEPFVSLAEIAENSDVITFHTPHTTEGEYATHHIADAAFFNAVAQRPVVINAARGPIFDTEAVLNALKSNKLTGCVIDCWEGEPYINMELLELADIATPHIAGYSEEGKRRATAAVVSAALRFFGAQAKDVPVIPMASGAEVTPANILDSYNPVSDTNLLTGICTPEKFEYIRNHYSLRHELGY